MQEYRGKKKSDDSYLVLRAGVVPKLRRHLVYEVSTSELLLDLHLDSRVCHTVCTGINSFQFVARRAVSCTGRQLAALDES